MIKTLKMNFNHDIIKSYIIDDRRFHKLKSQSEYEELYEKIQVDVVRRFKSHNDRYTDDDGVVHIYDKMNHDFVSYDPWTNTIRECYKLKTYKEFLRMKDKYEERSDSSES